MQAKLGFNHTLTIYHILVPTLAQSYSTKIILVPKDKHTLPMQRYTWHNHTRAQSHHGTIKIPVVTRGDAHSRQSEAVFITMFLLALLHCHTS